MYIPGKRSWALRNGLIVSTDFPIPRLASIGRLWRDFSSAERADDAARQADCLRRSGLSCVSVSKVRLEHGVPPAKLLEATGQYVYR